MNDELKLKIEASGKAHASSHILDSINLPCLSKFQQAKLFEAKSVLLELYCAIGADLEKLKENS